MATNINEKSKEDNVQHNVKSYQAKVAKTNSLVWVVVLAWLVLNIGVLFQFEPPRWNASYCQTRP